MNQGSINSAIKRGVYGSDINNKQVLLASEQSRRRREASLQKKRNRVESVSPQDTGSISPAQADMSNLQNYITLLHSKDPTSIIEAARQIRRLLSQHNSVYVDKIIETGVVPIFVNFLSYDKLPKLQFESVWALTNIASGSSEQTASVVNAGAIKPLLSLLESTKIEVQEQSVWALGNIAGDCEEYRQLILQEDGFRCIAQFAQHNLDKLGVIKNCIWCLSNLCRNQKRLPGLFRYIEPFLPFLKQMLQYNNIDIIADLCWAFSFLTDSEPIQKKTVIQYINPDLLMQMILCNDNRIQNPALRIAGNIVSGDKDDTQLMLNAKLLPVLSILLKDASDSRKKEILWILSNITAGTPKQIQMVIDMGFIKYFIMVMNTDSYVLQNEATYAVCNAINGGSVEQIRYIVEKQVIPPLVAMLPLIRNFQLLNNVLISINRILKVGNHIQKHCQLGENPYCSSFDDVGGIDRIREIQQKRIPDLCLICEHIMRYCEVETDTEEEMLPNI